MKRCSAVHACSFRTRHNSRRCRTHTHTYRYTHITPCRPSGLLSQCRHFGLKLLADVLEPTRVCTTLYHAKAKVFPSDWPATGRTSLTCTQSKDIQTLESTWRIMKVDRWTADRWHVGQVQTNAVRKWWWPELLDSAVHGISEELRLQSLLRTGGERVLQSKSWTKVRAQQENNVENLVGFVKHQNAQISSNLSCPQKRADHCLNRTWTSVHRHCAPGCGTHWHHLTKSY